MESVSVNNSTVFKNVQTTLHISHHESSALSSSSQSRVSACAGVTGVLAAFVADPALLLAVTIPGVVVLLLLLALALLPRDRCADSTMR